VTRAVRLILLCALVAPACGRRGDPLPPLRPLPGRLADLALRRIDDRIEVRFTVPAANADGTTPSAIDRISVYQLTTPAGAANPTATDIELAQNLKHQVRVEVPPPPKPEAKGAEASASPKPQADQPKPGPVVDPSAAIRQAVPGEQILIVDKIPSGTTGVIHYLVVGAVGSRRQASAVVRVPLETLPPAPHDLAFAVDEKQVTLTWQPGGDAAGQKFRVYDVDRDGRLVAGSPAGEPLATPTTATPVEFGKERCFEVRAVQTQGAVTIESAATRSCTTPQDTFMPPAPTNLRAFPGDGSVRLTWDAVQAGDLAGYTVLRGEGTGDTLQPLSATLTETTFTDTKAVPGVTYWYAVYAIDTSKNISGLSNRVQVTARETPRSPERSEGAERDQAWGWGPTQLKEDGAGAINVASVQNRSWPERRATLRR